jgi:hypothetical protein
VGIRVELSGGGPADSEHEWKTVTGGGFKAQLGQSTPGTDRFRDHTAGIVSFEPLTITGDVKSGRQGWFHWLQDTLERADEDAWERSVTLTELAHDGSDPDRTGP